MCKDFSHENRPIWVACPRIPYVHKYPSRGFIRTGHWEDCAPYPRDSVSDVTLTTSIISIFQMVDDYVAIGIFPKSLVPSWFWLPPPPANQELFSSRVKSAPFCLSAFDLNWTRAVWPKCGTCAMLSFLCLPLRAARGWNLFQYFMWKNWGLIRWITIIVIVVLENSVILCYECLGKTLKFLDYDLIFKVDLR